MTHAGFGTAIFAGGAWLPRRVEGPEGRPQPTLLLTKPVRILSAESAREIPALVDHIEDEQRHGNYVAGYLAYEGGAAFGLATKTMRSAVQDGPLTPASLPLAWMGVYPTQRVREFSSPDCLRPVGGAPGDLLRLRPPQREPQLSNSSLSLNESLSHYCASIRRVRELIAAGDTYQVNYTIRARFDLAQDPADYFLARALRHPVPYGAFLDMGRFQVISLSPELFLRRRDNRLESRPMKGTRPRGTTRPNDIDLAYELIQSEKDRAENLMIVDMVRNDLGRVCRTGSIHVPALFAVEPYGTVWQMASTVTGDLEPGTRLLEVIGATFPGASVTGAPKHHTMEIIRDLESEPRGAYTGTVALFLPGGDFTCNLAIRTMAHERGRCLLGVGSGIVWDSDPQEEYDETLTKAAFVFRDDFSKSSPISVRRFAEPPQAIGHPAKPLDGFLETEAIFETLLLGTADGAKGPEDLTRYRFLEQHLDRMAASAAALGLRFSRELALNELATPAGASPEAAVVRLELLTTGELLLRTRLLPPLPSGPVKVMLSPFRTDPGDKRLRHKVVERPLYDREHRRAVDLGYFDAIFINGRDHVTEGAITNLFARFGSRWVTPPASDGLLPGIWRTSFLEEVRATEKSLTLEDLALADEVVLGNSVRGKIPVAEVVEHPW